VRGKKSSPTREGSATKRIVSGVLEGPKKEEGNLHLRDLRQQVAREEGPSLEVLRPVQFSAVVQQPSPQATVGLGRRPQATSRLGGGFRKRVLRRACSAAGSLSEELSRLAGSHELLRKGKPVVGETASEMRVSLGGPPTCGPSWRNVRIGCSWACPRLGKTKLQLQKSMGGSRVQRSAGRRSAWKARSVAIGGDGDLAGRNPERKAKAAL